MSDGHKLDVTAPTAVLVVAVGRGLGGCDGEMERGTERGMKVQALSPARGGARERRSE